MKAYLNLLFRVLMVLCFLSGSGSAAAYTFMQDSIYYFVSGNMAVVTFKDNNYNSYQGNVNIPASVTHDGVTYQPCL